MKKVLLSAGGLLLPILALLIGSVQAGSHGSQESSIHAKGDRCVEETPLMRRNHMEMLLHQRDDTLRRGIRTKQHSLKECINCHVLPDDHGDYPKLGTKDHFCSACHISAAVKPDCFQCHRSTP